MKILFPNHRSMGGGEELTYAVLDVNLQTAVGKRTSWIGKLLAPVNFVLSYSEDRPGGMHEMTIYHVPVTMIWTETYTGGSEDNVHPVDLTRNLCRLQRHACGSNLQSLYKTKTEECWRELLEAKRRLFGS